MDMGEQLVMVEYLFMKVNSKMENGMDVRDIILLLETTELWYAKKILQYRKNATIQTTN